MTTALQMESVREEMRRMLSNKATMMEVRKALRLSKSGYYRQLAVIKVQNRKWIEELAKDEFVFEYRLSLESLKEFQRHLMEIAEKSKNDRHRIEAYRLCKEIELDVFRLLGEGPTVLALKRKAAAKAERLRSASSPS